MSDLLELAERCEKAEGPDRRLDAAIWYAVVEKPLPGERRDKDMVGKWPSYTASIDAALTLVPEGMGYGVADPKHGVCASWLIFHRDGLHIERRASTPALALCAAALRARAA